DHIFLSPRRVCRLFVGNFQLLILGILQLMFTVFMAVSLFFYSLGKRLAKR
ncbi:membrane protein implicated in regulation of membrane protease activity, partial [Paenibacillus sp. DS2015]